MKWSDKVKELQDPFREVLGLPLGDFGQYFVGTRGNYQEYENTEYTLPRYEHIVNKKRPLAYQVGIWCNWEVKTRGDKSFLAWNGGEKFYNYVEWLDYLLNNFFIPWNYTLS